jgi:hypothetical protein
MRSDLLHATTSSCSVGYSKQSITRLGACRNCCSEAEAAARPPLAEAPALDDQQLYGGTQSALSTTLLLWRSSAGVDGAPIVEEEHSAFGLVRLVRRGRAREQATAATSLLKRRGPFGGRCSGDALFRAPLRRGEGPGSAVVCLGRRIG